MAPIGSAASRARPAPRISAARLSGPSPALDHRVYAFRRDLADVALAGDYAAAAYARPVALSCIAARTMVRAAPRSSAGAGSELLFGEPFLAMEIGGEWAWGYCGTDRYVGYVPSSAIGPAATSTHRVSAAAGLLFAAADVRSAHIGELPFGSLVAAHGREGAFHRVVGGLIHDRHLAPIDAAVEDWVDTAKQFLGAPYLWGGRTRNGIDCSGVVQMALGAAGVAVPRDSDMQFDRLGTIVDAPRRGDLAFFPGHVGIMVDAANLLHANAYWMATLIEPLSTVVERSAADGRPLTAFKRL